MENAIIVIYSLVMIAFVAALISPRKVLVFIGNVEKRTRLMATGIFFGATVLLGVFMAATGVEMTVEEPKEVYTVETREESMAGGMKVKYTIEINEKLNQEKLHYIGRKLIEQEKSDKNVFVEFYLKGADRSVGNYGLTKRIDGNEIETNVNFKDSIE